ncbi:MAG: hypothetical protein IT359_02350 [Gemmatimonadaceae bacterium]|nr:hypothetical protein [Gemmatimonadaceae bacterium]
MIRNGDAVEVVGAAAIRAALVDMQESSVRRNPQGTHALVDDQQERIRITNAASIVLVNGSKFMYTSVTFTNKNTNKLFTFSGQRTVSARVGGAVMPIWSQSGTQTFADTAYSKTAVWDDFSVSTGCHFTSSNSTDHAVEWPWGLFVPPGLKQTATDHSGGSNEINRNCAPVAPPPAPPPPSGPLCDDPDGSGCSGGGTTGSPAYGVGGGAKEVGRGGGYKTVCDVTDWYENGVFIETTIDRCWTEPIYR